MHARGSPAAPASLPQGVDFPSHKQRHAQDQKAIGGGDDQYHIFCRLNPRQTQQDHERRRTKTDDKDHKGRTELACKAQARPARQHRIHAHIGAGTLD